MALEDPCTNGWKIIYVIEPNSLWQTVADHPWEMQLMMFRKVLY